MQVMSPQQVKESDKKMLDFVKDILKLKKYKLDFVNTITGLLQNMMRLAEAHKHEKRR